MTRRKRQQTQAEAWMTIAKTWVWLTKKNPLIMGPLTFYLLFGGAIFGYNYLSVDKMEVEKAVPLGEQVQFSVMPKAYAGQGVPIVWMGKTWGYEDTTMVVKKVLNENFLLVYDKVAGSVSKVRYSGEIRK